MARTHQVSWPTAQAAVDERADAVLGESEATPFLGLDETRSGTSRWVHNPETGTWCRPPTTLTSPGGSSRATFGFTKNADHTVQLGVSESGLVAADAVILVRDTSGETDAEAKDITYTYDPNGNMTGITDNSSDADVDNYEIDYTGLNQVHTVEELAGGSVVNTTEFTYDANGNPLTTTHDDQHAEYAYTVRNLVDQVTNANSVSDPDPKVTGYTYTARGQTATEVKANGNTVSFDYYLDGLLQHQVETQPDGTVVAEHTIGYDPNGNRTSDLASTMDADRHNKSSDRRYSYTYDPRDRVAHVSKTNTEVYQGSWTGTLD